LYRVPDGPALGFLQVVGSCDERRVPPELGVRREDLQRSAGLAGDSAQAAARVTGTTPRA